MKPAITLAILMTCFVAPAVADEIRTVYVADGNRLPRVKVGDIVRITQSGAAGRTEISASVTGSARLAATNNIIRCRDGQPLIGAVVKEFDFKAEKPGKATIRVTTKDLIDKTTGTKEYTLDIE